MEDLLHLAIDAQSLIFWAKALSDKSATRRSGTTPIACRFVHMFAAQQDTNHPILSAPGRVHPQSLPSVEDP